MAKFDKKWWFVHVPATVVVAGLIAFGVTKCNRLENVKQQSAESVENMANATEKLNQAAAKIDSLFVVGNAKSDTIRQLKVVVEKQHDSIVGLNKSLDVVKAQLEDCENDKKSQQQQAKKSSKSKSARSTAAKRPATKPVRKVVVQTVDTCSNGNATVRVSASENSGNIVVTGKNNATVILENSSTNSGNIIVGNGNDIQIFGTGADSVVVRANQPVVRDAVAPQNDSVVCTFGWKTVVVNTR